jgi:hypothetical protein
MKYLEQRVEELEKEVNLLKAKKKLNNTYSYLNNYPPYDNRNSPDYMYNNSNTTLLSESGLGAYTGHYWDSSELEKNPLDTVTVNLSSMFGDTLDSCNYVNSSDMPYYHPEYPNILGSWDDSIKSQDVIYDTDEYGFKMNYDKMDKDFLEWLSKDNKKTNLEKKIESKYGVIISKFPILHHEWEMDGYGYIVESSYYLESSRDLILTDHGVPYKANKEDLSERLSKYKDVIQKTERAMFLLG